MFFGKNRHRQDDGGRRGSAPRGGARQEDFIRKKWQGTVGQWLREGMTDLPLGGLRLRCRRKCAGAGEEKPVPRDVINSHIVMMFPPVTFICLAAEEERNYGE